MHSSWLRKTWRLSPQIWHYAHVAAVVTDICTLWRHGLPTAGALWRAIEYADSGKVLQIHWQDE